MWLLMLLLQLCFSRSLWDKRGGWVLPSLPTSFPLFLCQ